MSRVSRRSSVSPPSSAAAPAAMFGLRRPGPAPLLPSQRRRTRLRSSPAAARGLPPTPRAALLRASPRREVSSPPERDGGEGSGRGVAALPGKETPALELEMGAGHLGLHFPGGRARDRKCGEPIRGGGGRVRGHWRSGEDCVLVCDAEGSRFHTPGVLVAAASGGERRVSETPATHCGSGVRKSSDGESGDLGSSAGSATASLRAVATPHSSSAFSCRTWTPLSAPFLLQVWCGCTGTKALRKSQSAGGTPRPNCHRRLARTNSPTSPHKSRGSGAGFLEGFSGQLSHTGAAWKVGSVISVARRSALPSYLLTVI